MTARAQRPRSSRVADIDARAALAAPGATIGTLPAPFRRRNILDAAADFLQSITAATLIIPAALVLWAFSLPAVDVSNLTDYGLPPALPLTWYLALAGLVGGAVIALRHDEPRPLVLVLYAACIVAVLYGTVPLVSHAPQYSWVYKHIGVTRYLEAHGHTSPNLDIYNRWPGFFALAAFASRIAGMPNPVSYAAWAEPVFAGLGALLVAAAARTVVASTRVAGTAAIVFILTNWVAQSYFAPQAAGFILTLGLFVLVLRDRPATGGRFVHRLVHVAERVLRTPQEPDSGSGALRLPRVSLAIIVFIDAAVVVTHQLTPYMILLGVAALMAIGAVRPRRVLIPMAVLTLGYLLLNLDYLEQNFALFSSLNPFSNTQHSAGYGNSPLPGINFAGLAGRGLTFLLWFGAAAAAGKLARLGRLRSALPVMVLAVSPFAVVFGQNYGGEAVYRVILFTIPWCSILVAWGLSVVRRPQLRVALTAATLGAMAALFVPAFMGQATINLMRAGEVKASDVLYARAPRGSVIVPAAPNFPTRYGPRYDQFVGSVADRPNLLVLDAFRNRPLGPRDVPAVIREINSFSGRGFLVFSTSQENYARIFRLTPPGGLHDLERAVARSPRFHLWYGNPDARIYELGPGGSRPTPGSAADISDAPPAAGGSSKSGLPPLAVLVAGGVLALGLGALRVRARARAERGALA